MRQVLATLALSVAMSACGGSAASRSTFVDKMPPPEETSVMKDGEVVLANCSGFESRSDVALVLCSPEMAPAGQQ
jgi:hypothetical protein